MIRKQMADDVELANLSYDNLIEYFTCKELLAAWVENELIIRRELDLESIEEKLTYDIDLLTEKEKSEAEVRYSILEPILNKQIKPKDYGYYVENLSAEKKELIGSVSTLYRFKKRWDTTQDIRSLVNSERFRKRDNYTDPTVVAIIKSIINELDKKGQKYSVREITIKMEKQVNSYNETREEEQELLPCSETTVFRIIQKLTDSYEKDKSRHGIVQAKLNRDGSRANVEVERPLERVEIDWTPIDLLIVDTLTSKRKRHYLVYAIDVLTGYPLGFYISPTEPDTKAVKQCLLHVILPKVHLRRLYPKLKHDWLAYGVPENIVLDNAKVNESMDLEEVCNFLRIGVQYCPVKTGHHKGKIERALQTLNTKVFHKTPGTTYSNPQERSQYNSDKEACITLGHLYEMIYITFIELIANDYSIANGGVPEQLWQESLKETKVHRKLPFMKEHLKVLLGSGICYRTITNKGVEIQSQHYISTEVMKLFDHKKRTKNVDPVRIRYDLSDMRVIYVWDEFNKQYISVHTTRHSLRKKGFDSNYPVHYEQLHAHSYTNEEAYRNFDKTQLGEAMEDIYSIVNESRRYVRALEKMPDNEKAIQFANEMGIIRAGYEAQLASDDISSLEIINEVLPKKVKKGETTKSKSLKSDNNKSNHVSYKKNVVNYNNVELNADNDLEIVVKKRGRE
jgi:putative transposase